MIILHIETSTNVCSVAVSQDGNCIYSNSNSDGMNHATMLSPFIAEALEFIESRNVKLDAIAVSGGPGSYTGLRIGVSTAKGLSYGLNIPLIAVDTLAIMADMAIKRTAAIADTDLFCPMIDARRMEVYAGLFTSKMELKTAISALIIDESSYSSELMSKRIYFFGNGADKCQAVISNPNATFIPDVYPLAENMIALAEEKFINAEFANVAYYEPFYLKEFQLSTPKNKA